MTGPGPIPDPLPLLESGGDAEWDFTAYGFTRAGTDPGTGRGIWVPADPEE
jgi:hypothetical protein